jgi:hypothetical protein
VYFKVLDLSGSQIPSSGIYLAIRLK